MDARNTIRLLFFLVPLGLSASGIQAGTWWRRPWAYRVGVTFPPGKRGQSSPTGLTGDDVGVVTFHHGGGMQPDGRDVRVVTSRGRITPHRILMNGPGDQIRVAFALQRDVPKYYVYFGNANPEAPDTKLKIQRGVLIEMWPYNGGRANTPQQALQTFERAKSRPALGANFAADIFQGCNPFGPERNIVGRYTAWIRAPQDGEYEFATSSMNASFLWVDDALVVSNGRWHGPQHRIVRRGKVALRQGLHKLTFLHVSPWGEPIAVVVWRPPARKWGRLDAKSITPVRLGSPGVIEKRGRTVNIDFTVRPGGEVFGGESYYQRRDFVARIQGRGDHGVKWNWDFGDGLTGEGKEVQHVYLVPGVYTITLIARGPGRPMNVTHKIQIDRPWARRAFNRLERLSDYAEQVATYDLAKLPAPSNAEAVQLFYRARDREQLTRACETFLKRNKTDADSVKFVLPMYVKAMLTTYSSADARKAVAALKKAAGMTDQPILAADMQLRAAAVLIDPLGQPDEALPIIEHVLAASEDRPAVLRRARIALGDAYRAQGSRQKALAAYNQAGVVDEKARKHPALVRGDFARRAEAYLNTKKHNAAQEVLDQWEEIFPADRLEGYSTLLRVELLLERRQYAAAARQAETLVKVSPQSPYAPQILMQAYEAYRAGGRKDRARKALQRLVADYRESPLSQKAKQLLE